MIQSEQLTTGPESAGRLIVVAVGWILLAKATPVAPEFAVGFVHGLTKGASQLPSTLRQLLGAIGGFGFAIVLLYAASIRVVLSVAVIVALGWGLHLLRGLGS